MGTESPQDAWWTERHPLVHSCHDYHNLSVFLTKLSPMTCTLATRLPDRGASKIEYDAHTTPAPPLLSLTVTMLAHLILLWLMASSRTTYTVIYSDKCTLQPDTPRFRRVHTPKPCPCCKLHKRVSNFMGSDFVVPSFGHAFLGNLGNLSLPHEPCSIYIGV